MVSQGFHINCLTWYENQFYQNIKLFANHPITFNQIQKIVIMSFVFSMCRTTIVTFSGQLSTDNIFFVLFQKYTITFLIEFHL